MVVFVTRPSPQHEENEMPSMLITAPILPERLDAWRRCCELVVGEHREAYHRAIREGGVTRLRVWHHRAPDGNDHAIVLYDGPAPEGFLTRIATGSDPFATWFRGQLTEVHGMDFSAPPPPPPTLMIDEDLAPRG